MPAGATPEIVGCRGSFARICRAVAWRAAPSLALLLTIASAGPAIGRDRGADGEFEERTSSHFVLYQDVDIDQTSGFHGSRRFEQRLLTVLESAYDDMADQLGLRPGRRIVVVVYDPGVFDARFAGLFRFPAAGFYGSRVHIRGDTVVSEPLVRVLHHELVHAAFDREAPSLVLPAWLNEGIAEWFQSRSAGKRRLFPAERAYLEQVAERGRLFSLRDMMQPSFSALGPQGARLAYLQSYAFIEYLARSYGERSLRELIQHQLRGGDLDRAIRRTFRRNLADLEARYLAELGAGRRR